MSKRRIVSERVAEGILNWHDSAANNVIEGDPTLQKHQHQYSLMHGADPRKAVCGFCAWTEIRHWVGWSSHSPVRSGWTGDSAVST